jgi:hypothetical protein
VSVDDHLNPIIVKEVRQGLRTRSFWIFFSLMLFSCLVISLVAFAVQTQDDINASGPWVFFAYFLCLGVVQYFVIPYTAYRSLAREREDETWVLLILTGLGPRRILLGKLGSFVTQAALYGSAAGPFLLFSYYLNGIDLPTILVALVLGGVFQAFLTAVAVCAATLAEQPITRGLVHFLVLGGLFIATSYGLGLAFALVSEANWSRSGDFLLGVVATLWVMLSYGALLFEAATARLSLATENYARGVRTVFIVQLGVSALVFLWAWYDEGRQSSVPQTAQAVYAAHLAAVGLFVATDSDGLAKRFRAKTHFFSLLKPGALRGFRLVVAALVCSTAAWAGLYMASNGDVTDHHLFALIASGAYTALYLAAPLLLSRALPWPSLRTPTATRLLFVAILLAGAGLPPLVGAIFAGEPGLGWLNLFNPTVGMGKFIDDDARELELLLLGAVAVAVTFGADRVLAWRDQPAARRGAA